MCMYVHTNGTKMLLKLAKVDVYRIFVRNYFRKKNSSDSTHYINFF